MTVKLPFEITFSFIPAADPGSAGSIRVYLAQPSARGSDQNGLAEATDRWEATKSLRDADGQADSQNTWIFQASPQLSDVKGALRSVQQPVCLVQQFGKTIKPGDRVYLWECGPRGGIIGLAEVAEAPRIQPEPARTASFHSRDREVRGQSASRKAPNAQATRTCDFTEVLVVTAGIGRPQYPAVRARYELSRDA